MEEEKVVEVIVEDKKATRAQKREARRQNAAQFAVDHPKTAKALNIAKKVAGSAALITVGVLVGKAMNKSDTPENTNDVYDNAVDAEYTPVEETVEE